LLNGFSVAQPNEGIKKRISLPNGKTVTQRNQILKIQVLLLNGFSVRQPDEKVKNRVSLPNRFRVAQPNEILKNRDRLHNALSVVQRIENLKIRVPLCIGPRIEQRNEKVKIQVPMLNRFPVGQPNQGLKIQPALLNGRSVGREIQEVTIYGPQPIAAPSPISPCRCALAARSMRPAEIESTVRPGLGPARGSTNRKPMTEEQRQGLRDLAELLRESAETGRPIRIAPMDPFDEWWLSYKPHRVCQDDTARQDCSNAWHAALLHAKNPPR